MKKKNHKLLLISGVCLVVGFLGFAISPLIFDNNISNYTEEISKFENYRQLAHNNMEDASDWYRFAGITSNFATVIATIDNDNPVIKRFKSDYMNESKFALNSLYISMKSAKGEFNIDEDKLMNKWRDLSEPKDFFKYQKEYAKYALTEIEKLENKIKSRKTQINETLTWKKSIWIISIFIQSIGMFIGTYYSYINEVKEK